MFGDEDPYSEISCKVLRTTKKAIQIESDLGEYVWVPRSCLHGGEERTIDQSVGEDVIVKIRAWFADKNGLI